MSVSRMMSAVVCGLAAAGYSVLVVALIALVVMLTKIESYPPGAGPVLRTALASGWRPGPAPKRLPQHSCDMCANCCDKCNVEDKCCCKHVDKCPCPPPASPTRNP